jgi:hypothetical protein
MAVSRVKSIATRRFWELFRALPSEIQNLAVKNYHLWRQNPHHPSLRFRRVQGSEDRYSNRALARRVGETIIWVWIGTHSDYDRLAGA